MNDSQRSRDAGCACGLQSRLPQVPMPDRFGERCIVAEMNSKKIKSAPRQICNYFGPDGTLAGQDGDRQTQRSSNQAHVMMMTLKKKSVQQSLEAWPYRRECKGHHSKEV